jgi:hypothetical protein
MREAPKPNSPQNRPQAPVRRDRSAAARRVARLMRIAREERIISLLNRGFSVAEIAAREGLSLRRMRNRVQEILAKRMPQPSAEFLALQSRAARAAIAESPGCVMAGLVAKKVHRSALKSLK